MPSQDEEKDLDLQKAEAHRIKIGCFDYQSYCLRMNQEDLRNAGHKTIESALLFAVSDAAKQLKKLYAAHIEKYSDTK